MKDSILRICVTLLDVDPAIWRRIEVPANFTLEGLHDVLQIIIGWAVDRTSYTVTPMMSDGTTGPPLNLRGLFEQFQDEAG